MLLIIHVLIYTFPAYRENLTLSAHMKLPSSMSWREKFERVEQVIEIVSQKAFVFPLFDILI